MFLKKKKGAKWKNNRFIHLKNKIKRYGENYLKFRINMSVIQINEFFEQYDL